MKKLNVNFLTSFCLLTIFLSLIIYALTQSNLKNDVINLRKPHNTKSIHKSFYPAFKTEMVQEAFLARMNSHTTKMSGKFVPSIKLNAYQAKAYKKVDKVKVKLLDSILNNDTKKKKFK